jgi:hypothetical protein
MKSIQAIFDEVLNYIIANLIVAYLSLVLRLVSMKVSLCSCLD